MFSRREIKAMALAYAIIIPLGGIAIYLGATLSMAALILGIIYLNP